MPNIHSSAIVHPDAKLADDVEIGAFCVVSEQVKISSGTRLMSHVVVEKWTEIGENNEIHPGAVLGGSPQDRKYKGERSFLKIGSYNIIREYVTIHRASGEDQATTVGDHDYLMAYTHFGHNCVIGNHVTIANSAGISGHVHIEDYANIGGLVGVHQKVRIGKYAMVAAMSRVNKDAPPFMLTEGHPAEVKDINAIGLKRLGVSSEGRMALHKAGKLLFRSQANLSNAIETIEAEVEPFPEVVYLLEFMRGLKNGRFGRGMDTI